MSQSRRSNAERQRQAHALIFSALGDEKRLALLTKLFDGHAQSITQLTSGSHLTRQAVTKHLRILEKAGVVCNVRSGRQSLFQFDPRPVQEIRIYLNAVSDRWDGALQRLRRLVEE